MNKGLKIICIAMITLSIAIIITTTVVYVVSKSHVELLGSWILTETPVENVKTVAVFYFYGYDNFKYDYYINLDHTGNEKSSEARGKYTIDKKNKKIKLHFENGNTTEIAYTKNNKMQLVSETQEEYTFVSNETSKALEEVFAMRNSFLNW